MDNDDATDDFKFDKFRVNDVGADEKVIELRREAGEMRCFISAQ